MSRVHTVTVIDIGTSKVVALVGGRNERGELSVLSYGKAESKGVEYGSIVNESQVASVVKEAIQKCASKANIDTQNVFVGFSGADIRTFNKTHNIFLQSNRVTDEDVEKLVNEVYNISKEQGEEVVHVIPQSYSVDDRDCGLNVVGCSGKQLSGNFYVVVGKANAIQKIKQVVSIAGLNSIRFISQSISSADAVLSNEEKETGSIVIDMGAGTTDVSIYYDNILRETAVIPFGGDSITSDIKYAFQVTTSQAEQLKVKYAMALEQSKSSNALISIRNNKDISVYDLVKVTKSRIEEILAGVAYIIKSSKYSDRITDIVITGGTSKLKNITQLVKYCLESEVRVAKPNILTQESTSEINGVEYSSAVGLLIRGVEYMEKIYEARRIEQEKVKENEEKTTSSDVPKEPKKKEKKSFIERVRDVFEDFFKEPGGSENI